METIKNIKAQEKKEAIAIIGAVIIGLYVSIIGIDFVCGVLFDYTFLPDIVTSENYQKVVLSVLAISIAMGVFAWMYKPEK